MWCTCDKVFQLLVICRRGEVGSEKGRERVRREGRKKGVRERERERVVMHLRGDNGNLKGLILQDAGTVGIKPNEIPQGEELPPANVVVSTVRVDLEVMHMARLAQVGDGVITWLSNALTHQVCPRHSYHFQSLTRSLAADSPMIPPG